MPYPAAPWTLRGFSLQALELIDIAKARPFVPAELDIVSVLPGKTIGGVYVAYYGENSTLVYNELIVVAGLTRYGNKTASWISHIYVDNPDSVAGGREIWGLPKEIAKFTWETGKPERVSVHQGEQLLCSLRCKWNLKLWRQKLMVDSFSTLDGNWLQFQGQATANLAMAGAELQIPQESPFAPLGLGRPLLAVQSDGLELIANPPQVVGERNLVTSVRS
jgi:hypothetical protein